MISHEPNSTSISLFRRVRRLEVDAWERLTSLYGPIVYSWSRRAGLQDNDAADLVQDVFWQVFQGIAEFRGGDGNGGSFRGWLWTISRNQIRLNFRKRRQNPQAIGGTDAQIRFAGHVDALQELDEHEPDTAITDRRLLHRTLELIKGDFNEVTWQAFSRVCLQEHAVRDVADELGLTENSVRQAKFRVLRRLREEMQE